MKVGDIVGGSEIIARLGNGRFSTVWEASQPLAVKVYKSDPSNERFFHNEVRILEALALIGACEHVVSYKGCGAHVELDNGSPVIHPYVLFNVAGPSLEKLIWHYDDSGSSGLPAEVAKAAAHGLFCGLQHLHLNGIIHTDIKPGNILLDCSIEAAATGGPISVKIADFGSSTFSDKLFSMHVGTDPYLAPELVLEQEYTSAIDIWAACCTVYELYTGELLFDVDREFDIDYGEDIADVFSAIPAPACSSDEESSQSDTESTSASTGSSGRYSSWPDCYRHLALIYKVLGMPPAGYSGYGTTYYSDDGRMAMHPKIKKLNVARLIRKNYKLRDYDEKQLADFVGGGLQYLPEERESAEWFLDHELLE